MTNTESPVLNRVRKLLTLAAKADNEHEAANAAAQASRLMAEHNLTEAALVVAGQSDRVTEDIADEAILRAQRASQWKGIVAYAVAFSYGCKQYWHGGSIKIFGRVSAVQATSYTCQYLWNEIERLADAAWEKSGLTPSKSTTKSWKNSFRVGAASAVAQRLSADKALEVSQRHETAAQVASQFDQVSSELALVLVDKDAEEVDEAYAVRAKSFSGQKRFSGYSRRDAYGQGAAAGASIAIGHARGALKRGTEVLK